MRFFVVLFIFSSLLKIIAVDYPKRGLVDMHFKISPIIKIALSRENVYYCIFHRNVSG
jgi:hypothetical protein